MTFLNTWEDFEKAAERLYLQDPMKVRIKKKTNFSHQSSPKMSKILTKFCNFFFQARYVMQYDHKEGCLKMKMTDDVVCIQYKTDAAQDMRRMEKFANNLMRHMASKEQN